MTIVALDLGGTKLAVAALTDAGELLFRDSVPVAGGDVARLAAEQVGEARQRIATLGAPPADVVGMAVPGIYRAEHGTVWAPNIAGWDNYPLRAELQRMLGSATRLVIDSDRAACILGETWRGAARGARDAIYVAVGTGIGAGILVDGQVLRGHDDIAGAIGWMALQRPFTKAYACCGCLEHHASGPGLVKAARALMEQDPSYAGELCGREALAAEDVFAALSRGDPLAQRVLDEAVALWGMAAANLVSLFNPETIAFGGGIFGPAAIFLDRIRAEAVRWAQPISVVRTRFVVSSLGGNAALYGAARLALLARDAAREARSLSSPFAPQLPIP